MADVIAGVVRQQLLTGACPGWAALSQTIRELVELEEAEVRQALRKA